MRTFVLSINNENEAKSQGIFPFVPLCLLPLCLYFQGRMFEKSSNIKGRAVFFKPLFVRNCPVEKL